MAAWYNEFDPFAASWLEHLIEEGVIAPGVVDRRSIDAVEPSDLAGFTQCHFFAGIGIWSYALRSAGWPDDEPIWTGSCPCQPFSGAGKQLGFNDPRHKWPAWFRLITERRPSRIIGEQVDKARAWIDLVSSDLEGLDFAFAAVDIPASGFAGAHRRQRFYWVANTDNAKWGTDGPRWNDRDGSAAGWLESHGDARERGAIFGVGQPAHADGRIAGNGHLQRSGEYGQLATDGRTSGVALGDATYPVGWPGERGAQAGVGPDRERWRGFGERSPYDSVGEPGRPRLQDAQLGVIRAPGRWPQGRAIEQSGCASGAGLDWLLCRDSRWRPVEPGTSPLVTSYPNRMGLLRGYGNALDAAAATDFIAAYMETRSELYG